MSGGPVVAGESAEGGQAFRAQRPYVDLTGPGRPRCQMRRFDEEPIALPPHPCMLCEGVAFGRRDDWLVHVKETHHGLCEYRKQLSFLAQEFDSVGRVPPQLWRHVVEAFAEEYTTGAEEFSCQAVGWAPPSSTEPYDWSVAKGQRVPTSKEYADCAVRIVKFIGLEPWAPDKGVSKVMFQGMSLEVARDVMEMTDDDTEDSVVVLRDLVLVRMELEGLFHEESGGAQIVRVSQDVAVEVWSRDLLQTLPEEMTFIALPQLEQFFLGRTDLDIKRGSGDLVLAIEWGLLLLQHLRRRGILRCRDDPRLCFSHR